MRYIGALLLAVTTLTGCGVRGGSEPVDAQPLVQSSGDGSQQPKVTPRLWLDKEAAQMVKVMSDYSDPEDAVWVIRWENGNLSGWVRPATAPSVPVSLCSYAPAAVPACPASSVIKEIVWAPPETILRRAKGSDNWPTTWGDDDWLYTAYGDGSGFEPRLKEKLSLGLSRVRGNPPQLVAENLRAPSLETKGGGASGKKASGMLMVDGVLYLWARNAGNAQLAWSADHGGIWTWADWKLTTSFGCPTFLNFGRNYEGARDEFVYVYSQDSDSAYRRADLMVLARVAKDRLREQAAYEFFQTLDEQGLPIWTKDITLRGAVFTNSGRCHRSSVSYNAGLKRYLWVQTGLGEDTRFAGGLAIYDAPEPWGPWTAVFATEAWDVGPGEMASFPTKWISPDGCTLHLVFSGDDCFSVRRATLKLR